MSRIIKKERKNWFYSYNMIFEQNISSQAKLIYLYLCRCADEEGHAFPSFKTIADKCTISRSSVIRAIKELIDIGLLEKNKRVRANKSQASNLYYIFDEPNTIPSVTETPPSVTETLPPSVTETPLQGLPTLSKDYPMSVSLSTDIDGQTEILIKNNIELVKKELPDDINLIAEIELNIIEMLNNNFTIISGQAKSKNIILSALVRLTDLHIMSVIQKYKEVSKTKKINNTKSYIQNMIYNIAFEYNAKAENQVVAPAPKNTYGEKKTFNNFKGRNYTAEEIQKIQENLLKRSRSI